MKTNILQQILCHNTIQPNANEEKTMCALFSFQFCLF